MRNLLNRSVEFVGLDQKLWLILETGGFGDAATGGLVPTAAGAIGHTTASVGFDIPRSSSTYRSARSNVVMLSGKKTVKWSAETYIIPGTPDGSNHPTLPDSHPFLLTTFGSVDQTNPAQIAYNLVRNNPFSFRVLEEGTHFSRLAVGCVCDTTTFSLPGDGKAIMKFDGFGQDVYMSGQSAIAATLTAANAITVATGQGGRFEVNGYVDVIAGSDGNTAIASARKITGITGDVITVAGAAITAAIGDILVGTAPDFTGAEGAENALLGLTGSFSTANFGSIDCQLLSAEISIKNNYTEKDKFYGTNKICGFIADKRRDVTIKLDILLTQNNFEFYMNNKSFIADNLTITLAPQTIPAPINAALGRTFTFNLPKVEFKVPKLDQPADGYIKLSLEGTALAQSINSVDNELTLTIS